MDYLIDSGVHGIFSCGSYGEFAYLKDDERSLVWRTVVDQANDRVPIVAGTGAASTRDAIALTKAAQDIGVDAAMVVTPFYLPPSRRELREHYAAVISSSDLPIMLYNVPEFTGVTIPPDLIAELAASDRVVGMKDSSGNLANMEETMKLLGPRAASFSLLAGSTHTMLPVLKLGGKGANVYIANIIPKMCVELYASFIAGDIRRASELQSAILDIDSVLAGKWGAASVKEAMNLMGAPGGLPRRPLLPLEAVARAEVKQKLQEHGLLGDRKGGD